MSAKGKSPNKPQRIARRRSNFRDFLLPDHSRMPAGGGADTTGGASCTSGASPRAGGTDLSPRSAIALFPCRGGGGFILDRVAQVLFYDRKLSDHLLNRLTLDAGECDPHQFIAQIAQPFQQRPRLCGEVEPLGAPVIRVGRS